MELPDIIPGKEIYHDAFSPAMKQLGGMLESTMKVARFFAAPVEYVGAFQDRWQRYLKKIANNVPEENLIEGHPQIIVPSLEGLMLTTEGSLLSELFINLLAKSTDKTQQQFAHPAFPNIIKQLSHDEAVLLFYLKKYEWIYEKQKDDQETEYEYVGGKKGPPLPLKFSRNDLQFPNLFWLYFNHLGSLNLIFSQDRSLENNEFGKLFAKACIPDEFENL